MPSYMEPYQKMCSCPNPLDSLTPNFLSTFANYIKLFMGLNKLHELGSPN
jgi:hypothetical protein